MAMSVVYSNAFGGVFAENRGGTVSIYVPDTQGSTIGLVSSSGVLTDRWVYWPYGEVASRTGTNVTPLTWLGTLGYFLDQVSKLLYVRARHLRADLARWLTADPLWPAQPAYPYVGNRPVERTDASGLASPLCLIPCTPCAACLVDLLIVCPPWMQNWEQCVAGVLQNLPGWLQWLCGGSCAACLACVLGPILIAAIPAWVWAWALCAACWVACTRAHMSTVPCGRICAPLCPYS